MKCTNSFSCPFFCLRHARTLQFPSSPKSYIHSRGRRRSRYRETFVYSSTRFRYWYSRSNQLHSGRPFRQELNQGKGSFCLWSHLFVYVIKSWSYALVESESVYRFDERFYPALTHPVLVETKLKYVDALCVVQTRFLGKRFTEYFSSIVENKISLTVRIHIQIDS